MNTFADARKELRKTAAPRAPGTRSAKKKSDTFPSVDLQKTGLLKGTKSPRFTKASPKPKKSKDESKTKKDLPKLKTVKTRGPTSGSTAATTAACKKKLKASGAFGNNTHSSSEEKSIKHMPGSVFSCKPSLRVLSNELIKCVTELQELGAMATADGISPRDNELVASFTRVAANDAAVGELTIHADPRFAHLSNTTLLDFADGVRFNTHLTVLQIQHVELGNAFLSSLAESCVNNVTLLNLDLQHNAFTSDALVDFCSAMKRNKGLLQVDLRHQHSPIHTQQEKTVLSALSDNTYLHYFAVEFRTSKCQDFLETILKRNRMKGKQAKDLDKSLLVYMHDEITKAEAAIKERQAYAEKEALKDLDDKDCDYFYELAKLAKLYKVESHDETEQKPKGAAPGFGGFVGITAAAKVSKKLDFPATSMKADGSFLTADFISIYLIEDVALSTLNFDFTNQFKVFGKRFPKGDPSRSLIEEKFVEALLSHPRSNDINAVRMSNTCIGDDFVQLLCTRCLAENKLVNLHEINLEVNFVTGSGIVALSKCIANPAVWRFLQTVRIDSQKSPVKTKAEVALAEALWVNRTVVRLSLRVRNLRERERINKCTQRNIDYLRQARQMHNKKTGKSVQRVRNKIEKLFDSIAANDPDVSGEVSIVGDQTFLGLHRTEILKAAQAFRGNDHVTGIKMSTLRLDDNFAAELATSIENNSVIEKVVLDNNCIGTDGITALISSLGRNNTITEFQVRHQSKPLSSKDEEKLAELIKENDTITKLGVDLRSQKAQIDLDRKIRQNQEKRRKARAAASKSGGSATNTSKSMIKSNVTQKLLGQVIANDSSVTEVVIENDNEFAQMPNAQKNGFLVGLKSNTHVKILTLNHLDLDNNFADELASALASNRTIRTISLDGNAFTSSGVLTIALAANKNKKVSSLSIRKPRFKITNEDAETFIKSMEKSTKLKKVDIEFRDENIKSRVQKLLSKDT